MVDLIDRHLAWLELCNLRPGTIAARRGALRRIEQDTGTPLAEVTPAQLEAWWAGLPTRAPRPLGPGARAATLSHLRQWVAWAIREGHLVDDPTVRLMAPHRPGRVPRPIDDADLATAVEAATGRLRTWLLLAGLCGLRACEIAGLQRRDVSDRANPATITVRGKGDRERTIPAPPIVIAALLEDAPRIGQLWPVTPHQVSRAVNRHLDRCGLADSGHSLRHRFGTAAYRESQDLRLVQGLMGHASPDTTAGYAAWSHDRAVATVLAIAEIGQGA